MPPDRVSRACACGCGEMTHSRFRPGHVARVFNPPALPLPPVTEHFMFYVEKGDGDCWEWIGARSHTGYGIYQHAGELVAHRVSYRLFVGPIAEGLVIDHLCRNRGCVNPEHLEPVTHKENVGRGLNGPRTHCLRGHEFTPDNVYLARGKRQCRACNRLREHAYRDRQKAAT